LQTYQTQKDPKGSKLILTAAGLHEFRFHDLRITAATHMLANEVDLLTVSR